MGHYPIPMLLMDMEALLRLSLPILQHSLMGPCDSANATAHCLPGKKTKLSHPFLSPGLLGLQISLPISKCHHCAEQVTLGL